MHVSHLLFVRCLLCREEAGGLEALTASVVQTVPDDPILKLMKDTAPRVDYQVGLHFPPISRLLCLGLKIGMHACMLWTG